MNTELLLNNVQNNVLLIYLYIHFNPTNIYILWPRWHKENNKFKQIKIHKYIHKKLIFRVYQAEIPFICVYTLKWMCRLDFMLHLHHYSLVLKQLYIFTTLLSVFPYEVALQHPANREIHFEGEIWSWTRNAYCVLFHLHQNRKL